VTKREPAERSIARTAAILLPVQLFFRAGEAALPVLLAAWFGRNEKTDLFFLYSTYFTFAGSLVSGGFQDSVLVPILTEVRARNASGLQVIVSSLVGHALVAASGLSALLGAGALAWARFGVGGDLLGTAAALSALFALHLVAVSFRSLLVAQLNAFQRYFAHPVASGTGFAFAVVLIAVSRQSLGVVAVPLGLLSGELLAIGLLAPTTRIILGVRLSPTLDRPEPVRRFFRLVLSDVAGATITRVNPVIDQLVAAMARVVGGGTILRYAMDVGSIPTTLLQASVLPILLSRLSSTALTSPSTGFEATMRRTLALTAGLLAAVAGALVVVRKPLLRAVFLHGQMDAEAVDTMASVLPWAAAGSIPFGALLVLARAHVALQNTRIMLALGVLNASLNLVLDLAFVGVLGLRGIALATTLVHLVVAVVFWVAMKRRLERT
jgi:putative peptidoglycan lipid II flippase